VGPYVRKVKTSSGATAVQIVEKRSGVRRIVEHLGSARDELELALLMQAARDRLAAGQAELDLGLAPAPVGGAPAARVVSSSSRLLWQVLSTPTSAWGSTRSGTRRSGRWSWPG
jgi:hypothetical protein